MSYHKWMKNLTALSIAGIMLALLFFTLGQRPTTLAQGETAYVRLVRVLEDNELLPGDDQLIEVLEKSPEDLDPNIFARMDLEQLGIKDPQGLTVDPTSGHLHVFSLGNQKLYELSPAGQVMAVRDLSQFGLGSPQSMLFAPSGDQTDDPAQMNLYLSDGQHIVELSFVQVVAPLPAGFQSDVVQSFVTTDTEWSPYSSPDPTGIIYLPGPGSGTLLIADSEVDELAVPTNTVQFMGVNLFESSLTGSLVTTMTTWYTPTETFSDEPTGVTRNPANGNLFFSDDDADQIFEVDLGANGRYDWPGDVYTNTATSGFNINDPEGVTFANGLGTLFIIDDANREVYQLSPGPDGDFGTGDELLINSFNVAGINWGFNSAEGIAYNPDTGNLYVVGTPKNDLYEFTTMGDLVRIIDIKNAPNRSPSGLAYGPKSDNASENSIYISDRGYDSDTPGRELQNDGWVYEMTLPTNPPPIAVDDSFSTTVNIPVTIDVADSDSDPSDPSDLEYHPLDLSSTNTTATDTWTCPTCSDPISGTLKNNGDGTFTYTPTLNFIGDDHFVYGICDTEPACDTATVTITVEANLPPVAVDDSASTDEDTSVTIDVAAKDSDPNGNLNINSANSACAGGSTGCVGAANGTLGDNADGTITYTPTLNFNGIDNFVYEICDTGIPSLCDTATVTITVVAVNDPPVAVDDNAFTTVNTPVTIDVAANDSDPDGNLDKSSTNTTCTGCFGPSNGVLDNNGDGTFDYTPKTDFIGSDQFKYEICDTDLLCDTATVTIVVGELEIFLPLIIRN